MNAGPVPHPTAVVLAADFTATEGWILVAIGVLMMGSLFLSLAETALTRVSRAKAQALVDEGRKGATTLFELVERPEHFLNPVLLVMLICQLVQATLLGIVANRIFGPLGIVAATAVNVMVVFVVSESGPKTWAVLNPERAALLTAGPVRALVRFAPLRVVSSALIGITNVVLPGKGLKEGPFISERELLAVADLGVEEGVIAEDERDLIESIIEFGDTVVREVMVPRPDMITVSADFRVADVMEIVLLNGYSRLPAYVDDVDDVVGIVYAKDLMRAERDGREQDAIRPLLRPARFVPETKRVTTLLREMQAEQFHMAVVVDEYGGTAGLITLEDIIEELVGEIVDEFDVEDPSIEPLPGGDIRVHARTPLDEVNDILHAGLPTGDWDTIGGLLYSALGRVPVEGESVVVAGWRLTAQRIQGRRIGRVRISRVDGQEPAEDPDGVDAAARREDRG